MTEKLYWQDPYLREFTANIQDQFSAADGHAVILDRTCFYAASGGQPNDLGTLNSVTIRDVRFEDDRLLHILEKPLEGSTAHGVLNWHRRFDYMQQHTGQHILSAAFHRLFQAATSSFHLGEDYCSIELDKPGLKEDQILEAEEAANGIVSVATPVSAFYADPRRAREYALRKQSDLAESLRIIQIGDFDLSPCSGTHVKNAAEVGMVFVYGFEKLSQTLKIVFLCGDRIRNRYRSELSVLKNLSKSLTTSFSLLPESVSRLQTDLKALRRELTQFKEEKLKAEALELAVKAEVRNKYRLVIRSWKRPYQEIRFLAQKLCEQSDIAGALVTTSENRIVFFKNQKLSFDLKSIFEEFRTATSAKGGGPPHFLETGGFEMPADVQVLLHRLFL